MVVGGNRRLIGEGSIAVVVTLPSTVAGLNGVPVVSLLLFALLAIGKAAISGDTQWRYCADKMRSQTRFIHRNLSAAFRYLDTPVSTVLLRRSLVTSIELDWVRGKLN